MFKKMRIAIATVALASFLVGAMFNATTQAVERGRSPFGEIWEAIQSLQGRVTSVEQSQDQTEVTLDEIQEAILDLEERLTTLEELCKPSVTLVGPWSGAEMDAFTPVLQAFEEETGIDVEYKNYRAEELVTFLPLMFAEGDTPGDVIFMWPWFIQENGQEGHVVDVADLISETDFLPGALDPVSVGDALYGGAYTGKAKPGFWYRKSFFAANGLTPTNATSTWAEFATLLADIDAVTPEEPIVSGDGIGWPLSDITEHFLITFGGAQLQYDLIDGTKDWTTDPVRGIFEDYLVPTLGNFSDPLAWDSTALNSWWQGDYGLYFMGSWITGMVDDPTDLGIIPLPGCEALILPADYFFIPKYTTCPDEAKALFEFLSSAEAQSIQVAQGGHIAMNVHVPFDAYPAVDRQIAELVQGKEVLPDLDDTIGGEFQVTFWDQLKLLWIDPTKLDDVLDALEAVAP